MYARKVSLCSKLESVSQFLQKIEHQMVLLLRKQEGFLDQLILLSGSGETIYNMSTASGTTARRSEEHTSELQSQSNLVCRLLLEKKIPFVCVYLANLPRALAIVACAEVRSLYDPGWQSVAVRTSGDVSLAAHAAGVASDRTVDVR